MSRTLIIWAHPRTDSLTAKIAADVIAEATAAGHEVDVLDLYRENFNPVLGEADEPQWENIDHQFSPETMELAARTLAADAVVFVFPIWWYSFPAIMKGYIDRVWNYGLFYGEGRRSGIAKVRWIGLTGESQAGFKKRGYDEMVVHNFNVGIAGLCGIADSSVELLHDTLGEEITDFDAHFEQLREQARRVIRAL